jgi:hypothetical protein
MSISMCDIRWSIAAAVPSGQEIIATSFFVESQQSLNPICSEALKLWRVGDGELRALP